MPAYQSCASSTVLVPAAAGLRHPYPMSLNPTDTEEQGHQQGEAESAAAKPAGNLCLGIRRAAHNSRNRHPPWSSRQHPSNCACTCLSCCVLTDGQYRWGTG